jgi:hypothetical protein
MELIKSRPTCLYLKSHVCVAPNQYSRLYHIYRTISEVFVMVKGTKIDTDLPLNHLFLFSVYLQRMSSH